MLSRSAAAVEQVWRSVDSRAPLRMAPDRAQHRMAHEPAPRTNDEPVEAELPTHVRRAPDASLRAKLAGAVRLRMDGEVPARERLARRRTRSHGLGRDAGAEIAAWCPEASEQTDHQLVGRVLSDDSEARALIVAKAGARTVVRCRSTTSYSGIRSSRSPCAGVRCRDHCPNDSHAAARRHQQPDAHHHQDGTVGGPLRLTRHEASREDVDPLKDPDAAHADAQGANDVQCDAHWKTSRW
jgi:hypothetical protein